MASAYSITTYKDPEKLDISVLGKAMQYKQQNYDQNVNEVQQLVNQYAGVDLLKDVDKEYFGQRLNTIVKYVNESGTRDWSKKSVANDIQSYVSGALDENVINAISSTKSYQNQMAKIEEIKKSKPESWSQQNQEFATQDLQRYLSTTEAGDKYQAREYVNYKDVQKHILDNSKLLKEYGVEYRFEPIGGNGYFTRIGKKERIEPETAKEFLNMLMTPDMKNQLSIDGWYTFRGTETDDLKAKYDAKLDATVEYNNKRKSELNLALLSAKPSERAQIQQNISLLDRNNSTISDQKQQPINRTLLVNDLYAGDFYNKNVSFLSYDRVVDSFIDNSGFQMTQFQHNVNMDNWNANQKLNEFNYKTQQDAFDNQMKVEDLKLKQATAGKIKDANGNYIDDPNVSYNNSIINVDGVNALTDQETPDGFIQATEENAANSAQVNETVVSEVEQLLASKQNSKLAEKVKGRTPRDLAWEMVNSPSKSTVLYDLLSTNGQTIIDKTRGTVSALRTANENLKPIREDALKFVYALESENTKPDTKDLIDIANNGYIINNKGEVVKGTSVNNKKDNYAHATKVIGVYNSMLSGGNLSASKKAQIESLILTEINSIKDDNGKKLSPQKSRDIYNKIVYRESEKGFLETSAELAGAVTIPGIGLKLRDVVAGAALSTQAIFNKVGDTKKFTFGTDIANRALNTSDQNNGYNQRTVLSSLGTGAANKLRQNEDIYSLGAKDIDVKKLGFTPDEMRKRFDTHMDAVTTKLSDYTYQLNKTVNMSLTTDVGKKMIPSLQSLLPVGANIEKDSNVQIVINQKTGVADLTLSLKNGKEYEPTTIPVNVANLPPAVLNSVNLQDQNRTYAATNPYATPYRKSIELENNIGDYMERIDYMPEKDRYNAMKNPPLTKEDMFNKFKTTYGEELVEKNKEKINEILNRPIEISTEALNGKWSVIARQNGKLIDMSPGTEEVYNKDLMNQQSEALATQIILESITKVMQNK